MSELSPTALEIYRIGCIAMKEAGHDPQDVKKLKKHEVAFLNRIAEWHSWEHHRLEGALKRIMEADGPGADLSPGGVCYEIAKRVLE